jgi:hypothetical protein
MPEKLTFLGRVDYRNDRRVFGIKQQDRFSHVYVIGKTGTGKSTLLERMALQDLANGNGFALIDPHGDLAARLASRVPESRRGDLIYLNAANPALEWGYNPLRHVPPEYIALAASGLMEVFKKDVAYLVGRAHGAHPAQCPRAASCLNARHPEDLLGQGFQDQDCPIALLHLQRLCEPIFRSYYSSTRETPVPELPR